MGFTIEVKGEYACFSRPELKVERVSYEVLTPSAARGILEAVFWKPEIRYVIDEIAVCAPIKMDNIRRNEVNSKISYTSIDSAVKKLTEGKLEIAASSDRTQRAAIVLRDVHYVIKAHFVLTDKATPQDTPGKYLSIIHRRLKKGQCFHMPYLGVREFPAQVSLLEGEYTPIQETRPLGLMFLDFEYANEAEFTPKYFMAELIDGVIDLRNVEELK